MYKRIIRTLILLLILGAATFGVFYLGLRMVNPPPVIHSEDGISGSMSTRGRQGVFFWSIAIYLFLLWKSSGIVINDLFWLLRERKYEQDGGKE